MFDEVEPSGGVLRVDVERLLQLSDGVVGAVVVLMVEGEGVMGFREFQGAGLRFELGDDALEVEVSAVEVSGRVNLALREPDHGLDMIRGEIVDYRLPKCDGARIIARSIPATELMECRHKFVVDLARPLELGKSRDVVVGLEEDESLEVAEVGIKWPPRDRVMKPCLRLG